MEMERHLETIGLACGGSGGHIDMTRGALTRDRRTCVSVRLESKRKMGAHELDGPFILVGGTAAILYAFLSNSIPVKT